MLRTRPYTLRPAAFRPWDARFPEVAAAVIDGLTARFTPGVDLDLEHIGSTAVYGCGGKGNIDLVLTYPSGHLAQALAFLSGLGFPRWDHPSAHPESRPVHVIDVAYDNTWWPTHIHVIDRTDGEMTELRRFRDLLRTDPDAVARYEDVKRNIIERGVTFGPEYAEQNSPFVRATLDALP